MKSIFSIFILVSGLLQAAGPCSSFITSDLTYLNISMEETEFEGDGPFELVFHITPTSDTPLYLCKVYFSARILQLLGISSEIGGSSSFLPAEGWSFAGPGTWYYYEISNPIPIDREFNYTFLIDTHSDYEELRSWPHFSVQVSQTPSCKYNDPIFYEGYSNIVTFLADESDDCLELSISTSTYFWNVGEVGKMRFSAVNHCGRALSSSETDGLGMQVYSGWFTTIQEIRSTNAAHWERNEYGSVTAYFDEIQPEEEVWIEFYVEAWRGGPTDPPGHTFPSILWFETNSQADGLTYHSTHQTSNYVCNAGDDGISTTINNLTHREKRIRQ